MFSFFDETSELFQCRFWGVVYVPKTKTNLKKKIKYQLDAKLNYNYNYLCCMKYKSDLQKTFDKWKASVVTLKVYTFSYFLVYVA